MAAARSAAPARFSRVRAALGKRFNRARARASDTISPDANAPGSAPNSPAVTKWKTEGGSGRG